MPNAARNIRRFVGANGQVTPIPSQASQWVLVGAAITAIPSFIVGWLNHAQNKRQHAERLALDEKRLALERERASNEIQILRLRMEFEQKRTKDQDDAEQRRHLAEIATEDRRHQAALQFEARKANALALDENRRLATKLAVEAGIEEWKGLLEKWRASCMVSEQPPLLNEIDRFR